MTYKDTFAYIEATTRIKRKGKYITNEIKGHYRIIDEDDKFILLKEEELEIPVLKKDITKYEVK